MSVQQIQDTELQVAEWPGFGGGFNADLPLTEIPQNAVWDTLNVEYDRGVASKRLGYAAPFLTLTGRVRFIDEWYDKNGKQWLIFITDSKAYTYDVLLAVLTDRTPTGGLNGSITKPVSGKPFFDKYFVTNDVDKPFYWDGVAALFLFMTMAGMPIRATTLYPFGAHLMWWNVDDSVDGYKPARVVWSDFQNGLIYNAGEAGVVDLEDTNDPIRAVEQSTNFLAIGRDKSIYTSQFIGAPFFYRFDRRVENDGIIAANTFKRNSFGIFGLIKNDVINFTGAKNQSIGRGIISLILQLIGLNIESSFAIYDDAAAKHRLFVSSRSDGIQDTEYSFSLLYNTWAKHQYNDLITAIGKFKDNVFTKWIDKPNPPWLNIRWGDPLSASEAPVILYGDNAGKIYKKSNILYSDNGIAIQSYFNTHPSELNYNGVKELQRLQFLIKKQTVGTLTIYVFASDDNDNFTQSGPYTLDMTKTPIPFVDVFATGRWFYLKIVNNNLNETFEVRKIRAYYSPIGVFV